eukprot:2153788-Amphidinium_carterae.1
MDIGEPDNPVAISELVAHLTQSSGATHSRLDILRINLRRQQLDVNAEEAFASRLQQEYHQAISAMEASLSLQSLQEM